MIALEMRKFHGATNTGGTNTQARRVSTLSGWNSTSAAIPKNTISFIVRNEFDHLKAYWKGISWNLGHSENGTKIGFSKK